LTRPPVAREEAAGVVTARGGSTWIYEGLSLVAFEGSAHLGSRSTEFMSTVSNYIVIVLVPFNLLEHMGW